MYVFLFFLIGIVGLFTGFFIGRKAGFSEGWKAAWIIFAAKIEAIQKELYEEGKRHEHEFTPGS